MKKHAISAYLTPESLAEGKGKTKNAKNFLHFETTNANCNFFFVFEKHRRESINKVEYDEFELAINYDNHDHVISLPLLITIYLLYTRTPSLLSTFRLFFSSFSNLVLVLPVTWKKLAGSPTQQNAPSNRYSFRRLPNCASQKIANSEYSRNDLRNSQSLYPPKKITLETINETIEMLSRLDE